MLISQYDNRVIAPPGHRFSDTWRENECWLLVRSAWLPAAAAASLRFHVSIIDGMNG